MGASDNRDKSRGVSSGGVRTKSARPERFDGGANRIRGHELSPRQQPYRRRERAKDGYPKERPKDQARSKNAFSIQKMDVTFVVFLAVMLGLLTLCCIRYARFRAEYTALVIKVNESEQKLRDLVKDNKEVYAQVSANIDINELRTYASSQLKMGPPAQDQVQYYSIPEGPGYVRQFQDVPVD